VALPSLEDVHDALVFVEGLTSNPDSRFRAELLGGPEHIGWSQDRYLAASTHDLILGLIAGLGGTKLGPDDQWPRPAVTKTEEVEEVVGTLADFDTGAFLAGRW